MANALKAFAVAVMLALVAAAPAAADLARPPQIVGGAVDGQTLRAALVWDGDTPDEVTYAWYRVRGGSRDVVGRGSQYTLRSADVGARMVLEVRWRDRRGGGGDDDDDDDDDDGGGGRRDREVSAPTAVVVAATAPAPVVPAPAAPAPIVPAPAPPPPPAAPIQPTGAPAAPPPALLRPFPVVRIKGAVADGGARVTLLRVSAPRKAKVRVVCRGRGCPVRRLTRKPGRIHKLERYLRAGVRITIRVTRRAKVGKHVRLVIRSGTPPSREDSCVMPGAKQAVACPAA